MNKITFTAFISQLQKQQKHGLVLLFLFSILALSIIPLYRILHYNALPPGEIVYAHMEIARTFLTSGIPVADPGVAVKQPYFFDPFHLLLSAFSIFFGIELAALFLPFILGIITLFFSYNLFLRAVAPKHALLAGIFFVSSPMYITIFSETINISLIITLLSAGFFFFFQEGKKKYIAFPLFGLLFFYSSVHLLLILLLLLCFSSIIPHKQYFFSLLCFLFVLFFLDLYLHSFVFLFVVPSPLLLIQQLFSDLGGKFGFSFFLIILACIGFPQFLKFLHTRTSFVFSVFLLTALFLTMTSSLLYAFYLLPCIVLSGIFGFETLLTRQWKLSYLSQMTLFLFVLGILFSATSTVSRIATSDPNLEIASALLWLKENSYENAIILPSDRATFWTEYFTERRVLLDKKTVLGPETRILFQDYQKMLTSRNLEETLPLFEKYQIDYVVILKDQDDLWLQKTKNLQFLLENSPFFTHVFENQRVRIFSITYP